MRNLLALAIVLFVPSCAKERELTTDSDDVSKEPAGLAQSSSHPDAPKSEDLDGNKDGRPSSLPEDAPMRTAKPGQGKPGHVYSPYAHGKELNVTGLPTGTQVRCPYSRRVFIIP